MTFRVIWFVLAGFVLGFTTSTLWEWLYYRHKRLRMLEQHQQTLLDIERSGSSQSTPSRPISPSPTTRSTPSALLSSRPDSQDAHAQSRQESSRTEWQPPVGYRSSGIFLESEQTGPLAGTSAEQDKTNRYTTSDQTAKSPSPSPSTIEKSSTKATETTETVRPATSDTSAPNTIASAHTSVESTQLSAPQASVTQTDEKSTQATAASVSEQSSATEKHTCDTNGVHKGAGGTHSTTDHPDNLAKIKGIGEAYKRRLYATGIYTWRQLAESDTETLRRITRAKPNANIKSWQTEAREMAHAENRWETTFQGPLDDFTRIEGIGAITADILYRVGICTYEQLAKSTPDELARVVPAPTVGNENDFEGWIRNAASLARAKERNGGQLP